MEKFNFIRTSDDETMKLLISQGFKLMSNDGNIATFINDVSKMNFDNIDKSKLQYTNMLCI